MTPLFHADLPRPCAGRLHVYLLGPGYGESQLVVFPDGRSLVIDGCTQEGVNLTAALLEHLGITSVSAVVLTHPDLDHIRGVADIVRRWRPQKIFRYPAMGYLRDFVAFWYQKHPTRARYRELAEAIEAIEAYTRLDVNDAIEACASSRSWAPQGAPYTVHFLAPTHFDRDRVRAVWKKMVELRGGRFVLTPRFERVMNGEAKLGDAPNAVSLAVVVEWSGRKVLLAGDVENGKRSPKSGWKGVLRLLDDPDDFRGGLVDDVDLVKVAHHGSKGAFFPDAWKRHALSKKTTAILAPFASSRPLPSDATLIDLRAHCIRLAISAEGGNAFSRARTAGWTDVPGTRLETPAPCVAALLDAAGSLDIFSGQAAAVFQ